MATGPMKPGKRFTPEETSEEEVKCGLCKDYLTEPKLLSCLHCFCEKCIELKAVEYIPNKTLRCPTCNKDTEIVNNDLSYLPILYTTWRIYKSQLTKSSRGCFPVTNA